MIYVGIDVAKDKHDYCIMGDGGKVLVSSTTIPNTLSGFNSFAKVVDRLEQDKTKIRIGLEDTGDYGDNLVNYLQQSQYRVLTINPLLTANNKKANSLRKTKTDSVDAKQIATMLLSGIGFKPKGIVSQEMIDLKQYVRYRNILVRKRATEKSAVKRLINAVFPELEKAGVTVHSNTIYALLSRYPGAREILSADETDVTELMFSASRGRHGSETTAIIKKLAKDTVGACSKAKSFELKKTISRIVALSEEIKEVESIIDSLMRCMDHKLSTIPGIGKITAAIIVAEVGDFSRFDTPDKILAYAGLSPTTYQSGKYINGRARMEKRGSTLLRQGIFLATMGVCRTEPNFARYLKKKMDEGKHYYVAISSAARKLIRMIFVLERRNEVYNYTIISAKEA